ncbi:MAG: hydrogenase assembly protein HupF [Thermoprotei archaeon]|nr:MAG: hydrogenase assembly protein HupF [Thermoprotei archaeon]
MVGKLRPEMLAKYVLSRVGRRDPSVIVGPLIGEDAAVIDIGDDRVLVAHADPITGAVELLGWLAVHIASNDIAVTGARPRWLLSVLYLPENADEKLIDSITKQIEEAAREVGAMVVGGHSEFTPGLDRPMIAMTAIGLVSKNKYVRTGGAREGDVVIMTKSAGVEGTAILSTDFSEELLRRGVPAEVIRQGREFIKMVSVVKEALLLAEEGLVTSMHDPTEGGILGGLSEIAYASKKTIDVWEERIPVAYETRVMCNALKLDPLRLISSGTLIATVSRDKSEDAIKLLTSHGATVSVIGEVRGYEGELVRLHRKDGSVFKLNDVYVEDELLRLWKESR